MRADLTDAQLRLLTNYVHPDEATDYVRKWIHGMAAELLDLRAYAMEHEGRCNTLCPRCDAEIDGELQAGPVHDYLSTYCWHERHGGCRRACKTCQRPCRCGCHSGKPATETAKSARTWKSVYDIPFDTLFRGLPEGGLTWRRFTADTCLLAGSFAWIEDPRKLDARFPEGFIEVAATLPEDGDSR